MPFSSWIPQLSLQVWLLFIGRLLSEIGTGFTLFYAPIFFVNQVGFSATQVGWGVGVAMGLSGIIGRIAGGSLCDGSWGRKSTLLVSLVVSAAGSLALGFAHTFTVFLLANLIAGLGQGLFWPAAEALIADLTSPEQRNEAYALNRLGDNLGNSIGVALASALIVTTGAFRALFVIDALSFMAFFGLVYGLIQENRPREVKREAMLTNWKVALTDRSLLVFCITNILFTTYIAQLSSSLPLYFNNIVQFSSSTIGILFAMQGILIALLQLPVARWLNRFTRIQGLQSSALAWALGFSLILVTSLVSGAASLTLAVLALMILSLALVLYNPSASSLVVDLAPTELRGVYFSVNSLCWAGGYAVGPLVGGMALDLPSALANRLWLGCILSVGIVLLILVYLGRILPERVNNQRVQTFDLPQADIGD